MAEFISQKTKPKIKKSCCAKKKPWTVKKQNKAMVKHKAYVVERVMAKRNTDKGIEYFVAWSDFGPDKSAWITELPDFFEEDWGASSDKPFFPKDAFQNLVDLACTVLADQR